MPDYSHLSSSIADSRYVLAAHHLVNTREILEVGGSRIYEFMPPDYGRSARRIRHIDPRATPEYGIAGVKFITKPVHEFNFDYQNAKPGSQLGCGLCIIGMEMYDGEYGIGQGEKSLATIINALKVFNVIVIEYVPDNPVAYYQANSIDSACRSYGISLSFELELKFKHDSKYSMENTPNASFFKKRLLRVYTI